MLCGGEQIACIIYLRLVSSIVVGVVLVCDLWYVPGEGVFVSYFSEYECGLGDYYRVNV